MANTLGSEGIGNFNENPRQSGMSTPASTKTVGLDVIKSLASKSDTNSEIVTSYLPRENGFGDFCFGDFCFGRLKDDYMRSPFQHSRFSTVMKENVLLKEIDTFPFFKLPLEIRNRIYRLLCRPCFRNNVRCNMPCIKVILEDVKIPDAKIPTWYTQSLESFRDKQRPLFAKLSVEKIQRTEELFTTRQDGYLKNLQVPFTRGYPYVMSIPRIKSWLFIPAHQNWLVIDLIRNITNTCPQMRQEFGTIFWRQTMISVPNFNTESSKAVLGFLRERPAVLRGIKAFELTISEDLLDDRSAATSEDLEELGQYLAALVQFDHLSLTLCMSDENLKETVNSLESLSITQMIRQINVVKGFHVQLSVTAINPGIFTSQEDHDRYIAKLELQHQDIVYSCLYPESLLVSQPISEKDKYLWERKKIFGGPISRLSATKLEDSGVSE